MGVLPYVSGTLYLPRRQRTTVRILLDSVVLAMLSRSMRNLSASAEWLKEADSSTARAQSHASR